MNGSLDCKRVFKSSGGKGREEGVVWEEDGVGGGFRYNNDIILIIIINNDNKN